MRGLVVWAAVVVASAGASADVAGQSAATGRRPDPAAFLLPPVAAPSTAPPPRVDAGRDLRRRRPGLRPSVTPTTIAARRQNCR